VLLDQNMSGDDRLRCVHEVSGPQSEQQNDCYALTFACLGWLLTAPADKRAALIQTLGRAPEYARWA
jgi:hypothetical protein